MTMMMTTEMLIEETFAMMCGERTWWEAEDEWEEMEERMIEMGLPEEEVRAFFAEMGEEI